MTQNFAYALSSLIGFGPVLLAPTVSKIYGGGTSIKPVKMSNFGNVLHIGVGTLFCSIPVAYMCYLALNTK